MHCTLQEGAFALLCKSSFYPGEVVATRYEMLVVSCVFLSHTKESWHELTLGELVVNMF